MRLQSQRKSLTLRDEGAKRERELLHKVCFTYKVSYCHLKHNHYQQDHRAPDAIPVLWARGTSTNKALCYFSRNQIQKHSLNSSLQPPTRLQLPHHLNNTLPPLQHHTSPLKLLPEIYLPIMPIINPLHILPPFSIRNNLLEPEDTLRRGLIAHLRQIKIKPQPVNPLIFRVCSTSF